MIKGENMIKFGPSGNCRTFYEQGFKRSIEAPEWLHSIGLNAYEYSFGRGITLNNETATKIGEEAKKYGIEISVHAPYYINFANPDDEMVEKSFMYVINSLEKLKLMGGKRLVVHPASCGKQTRDEAINLTKKRLTILKEKLDMLGFSDYLICLETMGKPAQIGTYEEIIELCKISPNYIPTFDFGHINALTQGSLKSEEDYRKIIEYLFKQLGEDKAKKIHIHFSKIEYGAKGEIRHLTLSDEIYGPEFAPLAKVLKEFNMEPVVICESAGIMAHDALILKSIYENS